MTISMLSILKMATFYEKRPLKMRDLFRTNPFSYMTKCEVYFNISSFAVVVFNERGAIEIGTYNLQSFPQTHRIRIEYAQDTHLLIK